MAENTREIVLDTLLEIERGGQYSHRLIKSVLDKYNYLEARDKAFIKRVTEGTIERKIELDYIINQKSSVKVNKMKPLIRCLLRMSVYQLLYMDNIPDSAVCNEAVKLAGKRKFHNLKGFVNGVLRNISKDKENITYPDSEKEPLAYLSVKYSMPEWLVQLWMNEYGRELTVKLLEGLLEIHPVSIRFQLSLDKNVRQEYLSKMSQKGVQATPSPYLSYAYLLTGAEGIAFLPGFEEGAFMVQDVSSMLAVEAAGIKSTDVVMDICAAPGGKSLLAGEKAKKVLSRDVSEAKVDLLEENIARMKADNIITEQWDATIFDESKRETADILLMDVPCSGLGVIGKKRDIKYNISQEGLDSIEKLQKEIIRNSWQYVKPGGILLYSTCTIRREENEDMCRWICQELPFEPDSLEEFLPEAVWKQKQRMVSVNDKNRLSKEDCCIQLLPGCMESDGFFIARLRRKG